MSLGDFLRDRKGELGINIFGLIMLSIFLLSIGIDVRAVGMIVCVWSAVLITYLGIAYKIRKQHTKELMELVENMDKRYLISEMLEEPDFIEAKPYYHILKAASRAMREEITSIKNERKEYKEYIEQWIHEVKTPIAAIKMLEEGRKDGTSRVVLSELEKVDTFVEQALFYARSENVEKDYLIRELRLEDCVKETIVRNKQMFLQSGVEVQIENLNEWVYSDSKWIIFILNQVLGNAVKYRQDENPCIKIYTNKIKNGIRLIVEDNGIGISSHEVGKVFEKGFTGTTGRNYDKSTGIGLYLCKKLCHKLGLFIELESEIDQYTKVMITFPKGSFVKVEDKL